MYMSQSHRTQRYLPVKGCKPDTEKLFSTFTCMHGSTSEGASGPDGLKRDDS